MMSIRHGRGVLGDECHICGEAGARGPGKYEGNLAARVAGAMEVLDADGDVGYHVGCRAHKVVTTL